jgi:phosphatidylglycerol---prolipoprotein diacylglyceryl transferase
MLTYPAFDPVALQLGPLAIHWYGIAYVAGILLAWKCCAYLSIQGLIPVERRHIDDFIPWATLGILAGGRLGEVLFYNTSHYLEHPLEILYIWQPGMSFHGGFLGVVLAGLIWVWARKIPILAFGDLLSVGSPIGLFFGRIANFINGELYGRITSEPWGMIFPGAGPFPRHPSQLYEAVLEGTVLFTLLFTLAYFKVGKRFPGLLMGVFFAGYGLARSVVELYREPDPSTGFVWMDFTMGQLLSFPLIFVGGLFIWQALRPRAAKTT